MLTDEHECVYPENRDGNWTTIQRCSICNELPSAGYILQRMGLSEDE